MVSGNVAVSVVISVVVMARFDIELLGEKKESWYQNIHARRAIHFIVIHCFPENLPARYIAEWSSYIDLRIQFKSKIEKFFG